MLNKTTAEIRNQIDAMLARAKSQALFEAYGDTLKANLKTERDYGRLLEEQTQLQNALAEAETALEIKKKEHLHRQRQGVPGGSEYYAAAQTAVTQINDELKTIDGSLATLSGTLKTQRDDLASYYAEGIITSLGIDMDTVLADAQAAAQANGKEIPEALANGIKEGQYGVVASMEEVMMVLDFQGIMDKAGAGGAGVMTMLTEQMRAGALGPAEALAEAQTYLDFQAWHDTVGMAGNETINALAASLIAGETLPSDAMAQVEALAAEQLHELYSSASDTGKASIEAIYQAFLDGKSLPKDALKEAYVIAKAQADEFPTLGESIYQGIEGGFSKNAGRFAATVKNTLLSAKDAGQKAAKIHSPSKLFADEIGAPISEGIAYGIDQNANLVDDSVANMIAQAANAPLFLKDRIAAAGLDAPVFRQQLESSFARTFSILPVSIMTANAGQETGAPWNRPITFETTVISELDGREIARGTARFMDKELGNLALRKER